MLYRLKDGRNNPGSFGNLAVYVHGEHGKVPCDVLGHSLVDKEAWIREHLNDQTGFEAVACLLQDWELYIGKNGEGVWLIQTSRNPHLYRWLAQLGCAERPEALQWLKDIQT